MSELPLANLGALVSQAELLRARALALMQEQGPDAPVSDEDRRAYSELLVTTYMTCAIDDPAEIAGTDGPDALATVARLHRSAGLIEHELLRRLAELRTSGPHEAG